MSFKKGDLVKVKEGYKGYKGGELNKVYTVVEVYWNMGMVDLIDKENNKVCELLESIEKKEEVDTN